MFKAINGTYQEVFREHRHFLDLVWSVHGQFRVRFKVVQHLRIPNLSANRYMFDRIIANK